MILFPGTLTGTITDSNMIKQPLIHTQAYTSLAARPWSHTLVRALRENSTYISENRLKIKTILHLSLSRTQKSAPDKRLS
jgi:hypothetical protein